MMKSTIRASLHLPLFLGGIVALLASPSLAAPTDFILFQESGNTINEVRAGSGTFGTCTEPLASACVVTASNVADATFTSPLNFNIFDDAAHTVLSDTLSIFKTSVDIEIDFFSGDSLTPLLNATAVTETGGIQDVATISFTADSRISPFDVEFQSDEVPEPSSLLLLTAPLAALAFRRRSAGRRQRHSV